MTGTFVQLLYEAKMAKLRRTASMPLIYIIEYIGKSGAPDRIRTCGLCLRRAALYPAELRVLKARLITHPAFARNCSGPHRVQPG